VKWAKLAAEIVTFLIFIGGSVIAILDTLGLLDGYSVLMVIKEAMPKITLLLVGLIGSALLIQHWASTKGIEKNSKASAESTGRIEEILKTVGQLTHPTRILTDRDQHYLALLQALDTTPAHSSVDVTHFEKLMGTSYDVGENAYEKLCMEKWKEKVTRGDLNVRQIIHVACPRDLQEVKDRLEQFMGCLNYSLNIAYGPPIFPYIDLVLIKNHWGCVDLSSDPVDPFRASMALDSRNLEVIQALSKYFEIWWSKFSIPVKSKDGIHLDILHRLDSLLPKTDTKYSTDHYPDFTLVAQRSGSVRNLAETIVSTAERLHVPAVFNAYKPDFDAALESAVVGLKSISKNSKLIDRDLVESVLIDTVTHANSHIMAVSYDTNQQLFWNCPFGERLLEANRLAAESITIERIFLLTKDQFHDDGVYALLKKQARAGVEVYYAHAEDVDATLCRDFLIMDNNIVFEMALTPGSDPVKNGTLYQSTDALQAHTKMFENLKLKSKLFSENQKKL
jgi:hypothetical protein